MSDKDEVSLGEAFGIKNPKLPPVIVRPKIPIVVKRPEEQPEVFKTPDSIIPRKYLNLIPDAPHHDWWMDWHDFKVPSSSELTGVGPYFFDELAARRANTENNLIIVTGAPGVGKTYTAMRLGQIMDPKFKVTHTPGDGQYDSNVPFGRQHITYLIGNDTPLARGQVIVIDEAQLSMGSRRWYEDVQKDLIEQMEAVRSRGFIIFVVVLHLNMMDNIIRRHVLTHMIHVEKRGESVIYRLHTGRFQPEMHPYRIGKLKLNLPGYEECQHPNCLACPWLFNEENKTWHGYSGQCKNIRAIYERSKREYIGNKNREKDEARREKEEKRAKKQSGYVPSTESGEINIPTTPKRVPKTTKKVKTIDLSDNDKGLFDKLVALQDTLTDNGKTKFVQGWKVQDTLKGTLGIDVTHSQASRLAAKLGKLLRSG